MAAEACLLAASVMNAIQNSYLNEYFLGHDLSCLILSKGVFAAGAALILFSMLTSILYYWVYSKADTGYWERHHGKIHNLVPELEMA